MHIIGAGKIAREYIRVLHALQEPICVIGNTDKTCNELKKWCDEIGINAEIKSGGYLSNECGDTAIVALPILEQYACLIWLMYSGVKNILVEKPGVLYHYEAKKLQEIAEKTGTDIRIAYNRRYYETVKALKAMKIRKLWYVNGDEVNREQPIEVQLRWTVANSHLLDLVEYIEAEEKQEIKGDWKRWGITAETETGIYTLAPLEELRMIGEVICRCDDTYKPGFLAMAKDFIGEKKDLKTLRQQERFLCEY